MNTVFRKVDVNRILPKEDMNYFHILLESHEVLVSNGMLTESFQPSLRSFNGISARMRDSLLEQIGSQRLKAFFWRPDAMLSLKKDEVRVLVAKIFSLDRSCKKLAAVHEFAA